VFLGSCRWARAVAAQAVWSSLRHASSPSSAQLRGQRHVRHGGTSTLFETSCDPSSATATARFSDQNGDKTVTAAVPFTIKGCAAKPPPPPPSVGNPAAGGPSLGGLSQRRHTWTRSEGGRNAPKITAFAVKLPRGLAFATAKLKRGVPVHGAAIESITLRSRC
jgi:hypothetical protein